MIHLWLNLFILGPFILLFLMTMAVRFKRKEKRVSIVVLGDIGRSPRMQYHAVSLANHGYKVDIIGYAGSIPHSDVVENSSIKIQNMMEPPVLLQYLPRLLVYGCKTIFQSILLVLHLVWCNNSSHILVQNPPAIPSLAVCWFISKLLGSSLVIDWHNYGYTILSLALRANHPLVVFAHWYEGFFGRRSTANICVTTAMKQDLHDHWGIIARTVYDRPSNRFMTMDLEIQHQVFMKLASDYSIFSARDEDELNKESTRFTVRATDGQLRRRGQRPAFLISSTSWTEDEDFSVLLNALDNYESAKKECALSSLPDLVCVITGKGPMKEYYKRQMANRCWQHVEVCTPWLEAEDYPKLLGSADIGVCLHTSSSGLDLPMKVVDMFGCGVPVCAINFKCLHELVQHNKNGMVFHTETQLSTQLQELLDGFPEKCEQLSVFRENLKTFQEVRWEKNWDENVYPLLQR